MFGTAETMRKESTEERKVVEKHSFPCMVSLSEWKESLILMGPTCQNFQLIAAKKVGVVVCNIWPSAEINNYGGII